MIDRGLVDMAMRELTQSILDRSGRIVMQAPARDDDGQFVGGWIVRCEYESASTIITVQAADSNLARAWVECHRQWDKFPHPDRFESR